MAITAQELDRRITIQRATVVDNEFNEPIETWSDLATVWAKRQDVSDRQRLEFLAAGQVGAFTIVRFTVRSTTTTRDVKPTDRLSYDGGIWNIHGMKEADEGRNRFIEITAIRDLDVNGA